MRCRTTSSAAVFCETNSTVLPCARQLVMALAMVWLLPVPGGPNSTKSAPRWAATMAAICEESADSGANRSTGSMTSSMVRASMKPAPEPP